MQHKTAKTINWQDMGGTLKLPDKWFITKVDLDAKEPYAIIEKSGDFDSEKRVLIPKSLAYYLGTHWCGSEVMHENIEENTRHKIRNIIKDALGI